jgi:antitoxin HicB
MKYSMLIQWSEEDQCYLVIAPEWTDSYRMPVAEGRTYIEAANRGKNALEHMVEIAKDEGAPLPEPQTWVWAE